ncbi:crossover junction endodeoxyribonuclease RuvC [Rummeliibacillus stabekisii]|uniref:crossover junction endodeoxyribonuclease RuvC n=1 Tax=Rummeliibacillus stabekisii TaxID=241244 RepID=UPI00372229B9
MKILALDLSLNCTGYAIGVIVEGSINLVEKGHINNNRYAKKSQAFRLHRIANVLKDIFVRHPDIDAVVKERGFSKGHVSTQALFKVAGVADLMCFAVGQDNMDELTVAAIRKAVVGDGKASKKETADALEVYVGEQEYFTDDESDAVAVLVAYAITKGLVRDY